MNVDWLFNLPAPVRRGLYFGIQRVIGTGISSTWREMQAWEFLPEVELEKRIEAKLGRLLDHALQHSERYRKLGLQRQPQETNRQFLTRFPLLNREVIRNEFTQIVDDAHRNEIRSPESVSAKRYDWLIVKTGGTTGNPTTVVHDALGRDWGRATRLLASKFAEQPLGDRFFRLWGSEADLLKEQASLQMRVLMNLVGALPMNAFRAKETELLEQHATLMSRPDINCMMAYVDAAAGLAEFIEQRGLPRPKLRSVMACAGTVIPEWREVLHRVFGAQVFDKYGSRDCCDMACECSAHQGLHVFVPHCLIEIVDEANRPCPPGVTGRILVTLLNNLTFPMIRYEVSDLAQWAPPGICACGRAWPRIQSLQGRADDMLTTQDGTRLSSVFVRHFVGVSLNRQIIREWQLEQVDLHRFIFRYIPTTQNGLAENLQKLGEGFRLAFGKNAQIDWVEVQEIRPSATGKIRWIINSYRPTSLSK